MNDDQSKPSVLMICSHEPMMDPRVRWEAEYAAKEFDVTVLGFNRPGTPLPAREERDGFVLTRLDHVDGGVRAFLLGLLEVTTSRMQRRVVAVSLLPLYPLAVISEVLARLFLWLGRAAGRAAVRNLATIRVPFQLFLRPARELRRSSAIWRYYVLKALLRVQFGPPVAVLWQHISDQGMRPDVVHCNDLDTLVVGLLAKRRFGSRVVYDAHEFYPHSYPDGTWVDRYFWSWIERRLIRRVDHTVTVNPLLATEMAKAYALAQVGSVANAEPWVERRSAFRSFSSMDRLARGRVKFLFQGRFTDGRGIEEIVSAWSKVDTRRAALFLRGPANPWRQRFMELSANEGTLDSSVFFLDAVTEEELVEAAAEADVGIVPYRPLIMNDRLACPNKLSQYMHAGLMVLSNDLPYVRSVLEQSGAGLCYTSNDMRTFVELVDRIASDESLRETSRARARKFARETFNWQRESQSLYECYRRLSDKGQNPGQNRGRTRDRIDDSNLNAA